MSHRKKLAEIQQTLAETQKRAAELREQITVETFEGTPEGVRQLLDQFKSEEEKVRDLRRETDELRKEINASTKMSTDVDRTVFGLATGALALSVTFSSSLIPENAVGIELLQTSWISFTLSIIAYPTGIMLEVVERWGVPGHKLVGYFARLVQSFVYLFFMFGVFYFLRFALGNLPS